MKWNSAILTLLQWTQWLFLFPLAYNSKAYEILRTGSFQIGQIYFLAVRTAGNVARRPGLKISIARSSALAQRQWASICFLIGLEFESTSWLVENRFSWAAYMGWYPKSRRAFENFAVFDEYLSMTSFSISVFTWNQLSSDAYTGFQIQPLIFTMSEDFVLPILRFDKMSCDEDDDNSSVKSAGTSSSNTNSGKPLLWF